MGLIDKAEATALLAREAEALPVRFNGCPLCGLSAGHPSDLETLAENSCATAVLDRYGQRRGHVLVVLRRHAEAIAAIPFDEYAELQRLAWEASRALTRALAPKRVFIAALGAAAPLPMSFPHVHIHVIPIYDGGERDRPSEVFSWSNGVIVYEPDEARALANELRRAWRDAQADDDGRTTLPVRSMIL